MMVALGVRDGEPLQGFCHRRGMLYLSWVLKGTLLLYRQQTVKGRGKPGDQLSFPIIQVRDDGVLDEGDIRERGVKWLNSRHILKVKPIDFAGRFKGGIREKS